MAIDILNMIPYHCSYREPMMQSTEEANVIREP